MKFHLISEEDVLCKIILDKIFFLILRKKLHLPQTIFKKGSKITVSKYSENNIRIT